MALRVFKGGKMLSYQKAVTDILCTVDGKNSGRIVTVKAQRQRGKSFMIANVLLYYGINFKKTKNYYVAPTLKQSKEIFKRLATKLPLKFLSRSETFSKIKWSSREEV